MGAFTPPLLQEEGGLTALVLAPNDPSQTPYQERRLRLGAEHFCYSLPLAGTVASTSCRGHLVVSTTRTGVKDSRWRPARPAFSWPW